MIALATHRTYRKLETSISGIYSDCIATLPSLYQEIKSCSKMHAGEANGTDGSSLSRAKADLLATLPDQGVQPLWTVMHAMVPPKPTPKAQVAVWRYEKLRPLLLEAGGIVSSDEAERRVLMLVNPALSK